MMSDTVKIIDAVKRHHGGFEQASDEQCWLIWHALPKDVQDRYLGEQDNKSKIENRK